MTTEVEPKPGRRVVTRYSAEDRARLIADHAESGQTKKAFCAQRGVNPGTFAGWTKTPRAKKPAFAQVEVAADTDPPFVELAFANGARLMLRQRLSAEEMVGLVQAVAKQAGGARKC